MSNAERQKRYRDKLRERLERQGQRAGISVTLPTSSVTPDVGRYAQGVAVLTEDPKRVTEAVQSVTRVTPQLAQVLQGVTVDVDNVTVDGKCYNRPAVECSEFGTRPAPLDCTDQPILRNRGRYIRKDGTAYQFDSRGKSFECKFAFTERGGKCHLAVYETAADVRQAQEAVA